MQITNRLFAWKICFLPFWGLLFLPSFNYKKKKEEDQNISLALLLTEPDFSQEIYIFLSFSVKVSFPVFSPKEL